MTDSSGKPSIKLPIVLRPTRAALWVGGEPQFPIDATFYLTAIRAELEHMIHSAMRFRALTDQTPPINDLSLADKVWTHARGFLNYVDGLTRFLGCGLHELGTRFRVASSPNAAIALWAIHGVVDGMMQEHWSPEDSARYISDPSRLAKLASLYDDLPPFEFDFTAPTPAVAKRQAESKPPSGDGIDFAAVAFALPTEPAGLPAFDSKAMFLDFVKLYPEQARSLAGMTFRDVMAGYEVDKPEPPVKPTEATAPPSPTEPTEAPSPAASPSAPSESPPIDFEALAARLLQDHRARPAALVRFMSDRKAASFEDIGDSIYRDTRPPVDETIRALVNRTNNHLRELRSALKFHTSGRYVSRSIGPD